MLEANSPANVAANCFREPAGGIVRLVSFQQKRELIIAFRAIRFLAFSTRSHLVA